MLMFRVGNPSIQISPSCLAGGADGGVLGVLHLESPAAPVILVPVEL